MNLSLPAAAFLHHFLWILGRQTRDGWEADFGHRWQASAGITPRQWEGVKKQLGKAGADLLQFQTGPVHIGRKHQYGNSSTRGTRIRPTQAMLSLFDLELKTYDVVTRLDWLVRERRVELDGNGIRPSPEQMEHLVFWTARGGLGRLHCAEYFAQLLGSHIAE